MDNLQEQYCHFCSENIRKTNPFILNILKNLDEEIQKGLEKGITLSIAGNNRLVPVQRMTGEDFWLLSKVLTNQSFIIETAIHHLLKPYV